MRKVSFMTRSALAFRAWYLPSTNTFPAPLLLVLVLVPVAAAADALLSFPPTSPPCFFAAASSLASSYVRDVVGNVDASFSRMSVTILPNNVDCCLPSLPLELLLFFVVSCFLLRFSRSSLPFIRLVLSEEFREAVAALLVSICDAAAPHSVLRLRLTVLVSLREMTDTPLPTKVAVPLTREADVFTVPGPSALLSSEDSCSRSLRRLRLRADSVDGRRPPVPLLPLPLVG
mmetsp:Transcript_29141/g.84714  ORF Transcript_29141/g.84714 Transcript_29141/m.84714 type:complete len:231 (+) Transcript_29141:337-1029(+)